MDGPAAKLPSDLWVKAWMGPADHRVTPNTTVEEAIAILCRENVPQLLVMAGEELVGVVTDGDLRRPDWNGDRPLSVEELYWVGQGMRVHDVMTEEVITVDVDAPAAKAARIMVDRKIRCLPVLSDGVVVGILTRATLLAAWVHAAEP